MWVIKNGELIHTIDSSRKDFKTTISKEFLTRLQFLANKHNTHVNYIIENGLSHLIKTNNFTYNKENRPKDRIYYKSTYSKEVIKQLKEFAKLHKVFLNDVIESSLEYVVFNELEDIHYKHRIIKGDND